MIVFVEAAKTQACQDIEFTGFLTRNRTVSSGPRCVCAGEETGLHLCICFKQRGGVYFSDHFIPEDYHHAI